VLRQSERFQAYRSALSELGKLGLLYPSFLSRAAIAAFMGDQRASGLVWPSDPEGTPIYPGRGAHLVRREAKGGGRKWPSLRPAPGYDRALAVAPALSWRELDPFGPAAATEREAAPSAWGDVVLARKETPASYHLAVVVDDAFQSVSHVVRGMDLQAATSVHRLLQHLLGLPQPAYWHHRLVLDESGAKLSKSRQSETIRSRRAAGESAADLIAGLDLPPLRAGSCSAR
jgi:glutamyl-Q tRNA(Asp) synthetase